MLKTEFFKQWTLCFCSSLTGASVLSLFTPRGNMRRFYNILISLFVFVSFLYPLKNMNFRAGELNEKSGKSYVSSAENKTYENIVKERVEDVLKEKGFKGVSVECKVHKNSGKSEITVDNVKIAVPDEYDRNKVKNLVFDRLGINAEVYGIGE